MRRIPWFVIIFLFFLFSATDSVAATITLRSETNVISPVVRLSDVAVVTGTEPLDQLEALGSITICASPPPSEIQILSLTTVAAALRVSGPNLSQLRFTGSKQVLIRREYQIVTIDELQKAFSEHTSERTGWPDDSFLVKPPKNLQPTPVPVGKRTITVETFSHEDFCGSVFARFQILVNGKLYLELAHRFVIERYVETLVAARKIPRGGRVETSDVEMTKVEQSRMDEESFTKKEQAVGLEAIRTIYPGSVLNAKVLTEPRIIRRGQDASIILQGTGFNIVTKGRVLEDGCANELVRVRLSSNRKIIKARVLNSKTLQIARQGDIDGTLP